MLGVRPPSLLFLETIIVDIVCAYGLTFLYELYPLYGLKVGI